MADDREKVEEKPKEIDSTELDEALDEVSGGINAPVEAPGDNNNCVC